MRRMKPEERILEARRLINHATQNLVARFGEWNANKIEAAMERILRDKRKERENESR